MQFRFPNIFAWLRSKRAPPRTTDDASAAEKQLVYSLARARFPSLRQLRYLPQYLKGGERLLLQALTGLFLVALILLGARVYARNVTALPRPGGEIIEALVGVPQYVNPILTSGNDVDRDLVRLQYAGLLRRNARLELVPDLAESYDVDQDGKVYTFHLRGQLTWSDAQPITADDVLLTFDLIQDPLFKSPLRTQYRNIKVERIDDRTVRFTLPQPSSAFLPSLTVGLLPAHIWGDVPPPNFPLIEFNLKPIGSGPFIYRSLRRDGSTGYITEYELVRNPRYHGRRPYLDRIVFRLYPDEASAVEAIRSKQVESLSVVARSDRTDLKQLRIVDLRLPQATAIFLNGKRPVLKTVEVRRALAQAIDRNRIVQDVLHGGDAIVDGPIPAGFPGYAGKLQPDFDRAAAAAALEAAGWVAGPDGTRKKGNDELKLTLAVVGEPEDQAVADRIVADWQAIGVKVDIRVYDSTRVAKEVIKPRDFDAFLYGEILSPDLDLYPFWHSTQERDPGLNLTTFFQKDADKFLEELRKLTDPAAASDRRIAFQRLLADQQPAIFLFSPTYAYGLAKRIKGFTAEAIVAPADRFANVEGWYVKTRPSLR